MTVLSPQRQYGDDGHGGIASWATASCPMSANSGLQQHGDVQAPTPCAHYTHTCRWLTGAAQQPELGPGPHPRASQGRAAELTGLGGGVEKGGAPGAPRAVGRAEPAPDLKHVLRVTLQMVLQAGPVLRRILPCLHLRRVQGVRRDRDSAGSRHHPHPPRSGNMWWSLPSWSAGMGMGMVLPEYMGLAQPRGAPPRGAACQGDPHLSPMVL